MPITGGWNNEKLCTESWFRIGGNVHPRVETDRRNMNALSMHYALGRNIHDCRFPSFAEWKINMYVDTHSNHISVR